MGSATRKVGPGNGSILEQYVVIRGEGREQGQRRAADRARIAPDRTFHNHGVGEALPVDTGELRTGLRDYGTR
jgi:hypothetical protein